MVLSEPMADKGFLREKAKHQLLSKEGTLELCHYLIYSKVFLSSLPSYSPEGKASCRWSLSQRAGIVLSLLSSVSPLCSQLQEEA